MAAEDVDSDNDDRPAGGGGGGMSFLDAIKVPTYLRTVLAVLLVTLLFLFFSLHLPLAMCLSDDCACTRTRTGYERQQAAQQGGVADGRRQGAEEGGRAEAADDGGAAAGETGAPQWVRT
jgi:hypothetical protein